MTPAAPPPANPRWIWAFTRDRGRGWANGASTAPPRSRAAPRERRRRCGPRTKGFSRTQSRTTSPPSASEPAAKRTPVPPPSGRRGPGGQDLTFEIWCASGRGSPCTRTTPTVALPPARTRTPASTRERHRPHGRRRRSNPRPLPRRPKPPTPDAGRWILAATFIGRPGGQARGPSQAAAGGGEPERGGGAGETLIALESPSGGRRKGQASYLTFFFAT
jgi:hypothetical protein